MTNYDKRGVSRFYAAPKPNPNDERLTIQRLRRQKDLGNIAVSQTTFAHASLTDRTLYRGLTEYGRTTFGTRAVPAYMFDQHNHALFGWYEGLSEGRIRRGAILVHVDEHADANRTTIPNFRTKGLATVAAYAAKSAIYDFIHPALEDQLLGGVIWVRPLLHDQRAATVPATTRTIEYTETGMDNQLLSRIINGEFAPEDIIVDLDVDYYRYLLEEPQLAVSARTPSAYQQLSLRDSQAQLFEHDTNRIRGLFAAAGIITVATSPGYIDQQQALDIVGRIFGPAA